jgi:hypothetical protein
MEQENTTTDLQQPAAWRPVNRVIFRFIFSYLVLYIFPFPLNVLPYVGAWVAPYDNLWNWAVPWVGKHLFHVEITVLPNGSGDTTYNYVQIFIFAAIAALATLVWSVLDRRRTQYTRLFGWLQIYIRFSLATAMISYGAVKVIKSQFPSPTLDRLVQPVGDLSPMGLLWIFMGSSHVYNIFTGIGEMMGGLLLTVRRTTLLGALLSIAVLSNIVMLNFSYDVPVKLYSLHLLAMAVLLCLPELRRLAAFFVLNRPTEPVALVPLFERRWQNLSVVMVRTIFVLGYTALALNQGYVGRTSYGDLAPRAPLYGIWNVETFEADGQVLAPLITEPFRWRRIIFDRPLRMAIQAMSDSRRRFLFKQAPKTNVLTLTKVEDPNWKSTLTYTQTAPGLVAMEGTFDGRKIRASLRRADNLDFLLITRGFHWINEYPLNH